MLSIGILPPSVNELLVTRSGASFFGGSGARTETVSFDGMIGRSGEVGIPALQIPRSRLPVRVDSGGGDRRARTLAAIRLDLRRRRRRQHRVAHLAQPHRRNET